MPEKSKTHAAVSLLVPVGSVPYQDTCFCTTTSGSSNSEYSNMVKEVIAFVVVTQVEEGALYRRIQCSN